MADHKDFLEILAGAWNGNSRDKLMKAVWIKLQKVKQTMKVLNKTEYNGVGDRVIICKQQLFELQEQMGEPCQPENMIAAEKEMKLQLEK